MKTYRDNNFKKTNRKARVTLSGWDGKSYDGEGRNLTVYVNDLFPDKEFIRLPFDGARCYHVITNRRHPKSGEIEVDFFNAYDPL